MKILFNNTSLIAAIFILASVPCSAQLDFGEWKATVNSSHFFDFEFRNVANPEYLLNPEGQSIESKDEAEPTHQVNINLKFPLILKEKWQLIGIAGYRNELIFDRFVPGQDDIFRTVFHRFSLSTLYMRSLKKDWFLWAGTRVNIQTTNPVRVTRSIDASAQLLAGKK
ncbi:MAG: hypothetical protein ACI959_000535, partial [Limisphaerales bacterium]